MYESWKIERGNEPLEKIVVVVLHYILRVLMLYMSFTGIWRILVVERFGVSCITLSGVIIVLKG